MKFHPFIIILLLDIQLFAQSNFVEGIVITNNDDTIHTLICNDCDYYKFCKIKDSNSDSIITYRPFEIKSFRLSNGKFFISREIRIQNSYTIIRQREYDIARKEARITKSSRMKDGVSNEKVFLEFLLNGELDLHYYRDQMDHYYIEDKENNLTELTKEQVFEYSNGHIFSQTKQETFKNSLKASMSTSPDVFSEIDRISLSHRGLIKVFKHYHNNVCKDQECIVYEKKISKIDFNFAIYTGLNYSTLTVTHSGRNYTYSGDIYPSVGASLFIKNLVPQFERFWIQFDLNYQKLSYSYDNKPQTVHNKETFTFEASSITSSLKSIFPITTSKYKPFIGLGLSATSLFNEKVMADYYMTTEYNNPLLNFCGGFGVEMPFLKSHNLIFDFYYYQGFDSNRLNLTMAFEF